MTLRSWLGWFNDWVSPKPPGPHPPHPKPPLPMPPLHPPEGRDAAENLELAINRFRARSGLPALQLHPNLCMSAENHAMDMDSRDTLSHEGADGSTPFERIVRAGYRFSAAAENIASGQGTASEVVEDWANDPPHRQAMLGPYRHVGTGWSGGFWVADFATPN